VIHRACHLQEERLFDSYLAERSGQPIDPPVADHLADCEACGARYAELSGFMDGLRRDGEYDLLARAQTGSLRFKTVGSGATAVLSRLQPDHCWLPVASSWDAAGLKGCTRVPRAR
jgi:hypothetical protein